ncbi:MAG: hypothetical protein AABZ53_11380, partial [Planctomycetota bacterium]
LIKEPCLGPCACAIREIVSEASGGYSRTFLRDDPLFRHYAIDGLQVTATLNGQEVHLQARGEYIIGGEVALVHRMMLTAEIGNQLWNLDSGVVPILGRRLPAIDIAVQSDILGCTRFTLVLRSSPTCPVDFNEDGAVDFFDYDDFVTCYEGGDCPPGKSADFDGDGAVDMFDYDAFVRAYEVGC